MNAEPAPGKIPVDDGVPPWVGGVDQAQEIQAVPESLFDLGGGVDDDWNEDGEADADASSHTGVIDEGSFANPIQQQTFVWLKKGLREACNVNTKWPLRKRALQWVFVPEDRGIHHMLFQDACTALGGRPDVVRMRTQHQLWRAGIILPGPLPMLSYPLHSSMCSEIYAKLKMALELRELAKDISAHAWDWPSIPGPVLRQRFVDRTDEATYAGVMSALIADGYIGIANGNVYFITRNPDEMTKGERSRFSFSGSIFLYDDA